MRLDTYHTDIARLALFDYRAYYMTLFNTITLHAGLWRRGMTLASRALRPGFHTHRTICGIGYFLLLYSALYFFFFFFFALTKASIFYFFFHIDIPI